MKKLTTLQTYHEIRKQKQQVQHIS